MKLALHWKIIIGLVLGVLFALLTSKLGQEQVWGLNWSQLVVHWVGVFGTIFINLLKLIAIPLILFSIIKGVAEISDIKRLGRIGFKTLGLYLGTTFLAVTIGLFIVNTFKPGESMHENLRVSNRLQYEQWAAENGVNVADGKNFSNDPKYSGFAVQEANGVSQKALDKVNNGTENSAKRKEQGPLQILVDIVPSNIFYALTGKGFMLQIIFFALFFGAVLLMIDPVKAEPIIKLFDGFNDIFLKMIDVVMKGAPFFVFCLLAGKISEMAPNDPAKMMDLFAGLGTYSFNVVLGLFLMIIIYPFLVLLFTKGKVDPITFLRGIFKAQTVAFSTSSSAATLPVTMDCVHDNLNVPKEVSSFVLPIGATVNMDGTSLYISIAVVFLAQMHYVDLSMTQLMVIGATATVASIGASAVPSAGLIMMILVLQAVDLNPAWIAIIFPVDRILDMCRTVVNVTGDASVARIVASLEEKK